MERITAADDRIVALSALFARPKPATPTATVQVVVDPRVEIEGERIRIFKAARDEGYAAGIKHAEEEIKRRSREAETAIAADHAKESGRLRDANEQMAQLLRSLPEAVWKLEDEIEPQVAEAAFMATLRVLGDVATRRPLIVEICRQALVEYRQRPIALRVAEQERDAVAFLAEEGAVTVVADARLIPGQCRLETRKGLYDTSLEVRLQALLRGFLSALRSGEGVA